MNNSKKVNEKWSKKDYQKSSKRVYSKGNRAITLIALIVTIIVLLILAGISISMLAGDNSILQKATDAKTETERGEVYEQISLATASGEMDYYSNGTDRITAYKSALLNGVDGIDRDNLTDNGSNLITGTVTTKSGKQYDFSVPVPVTDITVAEHKEKNPNELTVAELESNASTYFGLDVINYTSSLRESLQDTEWQLLYAGKITESDTEGRIYLISKKLIEYSQLPTVIKNGSEVSGARPIEKSGSTNTAGFAKSVFNPSGIYLTGGVISQYSGSSDITSTALQKLNGKYFKWLTDNSKTSTNYNMKSVAYMIDTTTWENFKGLKAEYAIGGPTIELIFAAYNKYTNKNEEESYKTKVDSISGYLISTDGGNTYTQDSTVSMMDMPSMPYGSFWIASPAVQQMNAVDYENSGIMSRMSSKFYGFTCSDNERFGFRPVICLNTGTILEKTTDSNENIVLKIVE